MAKTKSSKFSKVISELKKSNVSTSTQVDLLTGEISEIRKDLSSLENTVLLVMEKMRRSEKYPVVQVKGGKLIAPKVASKMERQSAVPANDSDINDGFSEADLPLGEYYKYQLKKLYNFMVRNAEDEKSRIKQEKKTQRDRDRKRNQTLIKELKKAGLDPKMFKKKSGLLGKIGTGIKWGIFGAIGAGLAGLVWMFKEEITETFQSVTKSITDLGEFLKSKFEAISGIYNSIANIITSSPFYKWGKEKFDEMTGSDKGLREFVTEKINWVIDQIDTMIKKVYDDISSWLSEFIKPVVELLHDPTKFLSGENRADTLARYGMLLVKGPVGFAAKSMEIMKGAEKATGSIEETYLKSTHGEEAYNKAKQLLDSVPDELAQRVIKKFLWDAGEFMKWQSFGAAGRKQLTPEQKQNAISLIFKYPELRDRLASSLRNAPKYFNKLVDVVPGAIEQVIGGTPQERFEERVQREQGKNAREFETSIREKGAEIDTSAENFAKETIIKYLGDQYQITKDDYFSGVTLKDKNNNFINSINNPVEFGRIVAKAMLYRSADEKKEDIRKQVGQWMTDVENHPWVKTFKQEYENIESNVKTIKDTNVPIVREAATAAKESAVNAANQVKTEFADDKSYTDNAFSVANLTGRALESGFQSAMKVTGKLAEETKPLARKMEQFDYLGESQKAYTELQGGIQSLYQSPDKIYSFIENLMSSQKDTSVAPDPNENSLTKQLWEETLNAKTNSTSKVLNNSMSTSETDLYTSISVRDGYGPFRKAILESWDMCKP